MALPPLPTEGANWAAWGAAVHDAVNSPSGATAAAKGVVRLTGDLGGTADAPTVPGLADKVSLAGTETVAGVKTFQGGVKVGSVTPATLREYPNSAAPATAFLEDNLYVSRRLGVGAEGSQRIPVNFSRTLDGSTLTNANPADKVMMQNSVTIKGDFTNETTWGMSSASFVFGANDFVVTGSAAGDATGIRNIFARLSEVHVYAPGRTLDQVVGFQTEAHVEASATGTNVTALVGVQVKAPRNAGGGVLTNAYGVKIESPTTATNNYAIHTSGLASSLFSGDILMNSDPSFPRTLNAYDGTVRGKTFTVGTSTLASVARLTAKSSADSDVVAAFQGRGGQTADIVTFGQDTTVYSKFDKRGRLVMRQTAVPLDADMAAGDLAFYVDATSGAMKLMIKAKDAGGTVRTGSVSLV